jgi:hypothetical protein
MRCQRVVPCFHDEPVNDAELDLPIVRGKDKFHPPGFARFNHQLQPRPAMSLPEKLCGAWEREVNFS